MKISSFKITNYKSFLDSGTLKLEAGFNVIFGRNNVGKTALLEALGLNFMAKPHRSLQSLPRPTSIHNPNSIAEVTLTISGDELKDILLGLGQFNVPKRLDAKSFDATDCLKTIESIVSQPEISIRLMLVAHPNEGQPRWENKWPPSFQLYAPKGNMFYLVGVDLEHQSFAYKGQHDVNPNNEFGVLVAQILQSRIYSFRAERMNVGHCNFGESQVLQPDAQNLAEVLNVLQGKNPDRFRHFNDLVRQIFPSIYQVSVVSRRNNRVEIVTWTEDPTKQREDLAIELSESGTGIGQVLAILYAVLTSNFPRSIIIDEPNSFLHPGAARKLIDILKQFSQHQFIISTHSPEIIRSAAPKSLTLILWNKPQSVLETLDANAAADAQRCLVEVGAKLSDVFGADSILWVEGQTEEECFPRILEILDKRLPVGVSIAAVRNTGDIEGKHANLVFDIYTKLSKGNALLPKAVAFIFDREGRTQQEIEDISRKSKDQVKFLTRCTFENYLLHPAAIAEFLRSLPSMAEKSVTESQIMDWLIKHGGEKKYVENQADHVDIRDETWLRTVNGAKLLYDLVQDMSDGRDIFRKPIHSLHLTDWLLKNEPNIFDELAKFIFQAVTQQSQSN